MTETTRSTHLPPGTLARSLPSSALDEVEPDPASIVEILDAIPGAFERAQRGLEEASAGRAIPLDRCWT